MHANENMSEAKEYLIQKVRNDAIYIHSNMVEQTNCKDALRSQICYLISFQFVPHSLACGTLLGIEPMAPPLEGRVLTTRLLRKSLLFHFL